MKPLTRELRWMFTGRYFAKTPTAALNSSCTRPSSPVPITNASMPLKLLSRCCHAANRNDCVETCSFCVSAVIAANVSPETGCSIVSHDDLSVTASLRNTNGKRGYSRPENSDDFQYGVWLWSAGFSSNWFCHSERSAYCRVSTSSMFRPEYTACTSRTTFTTPAMSAHRAEAVAMRRCSDSANVTSANDMAGRFDELRKHPHCFSRVSRISNSCLCADIPRKSIIDARLGAEPFTICTGTEVPSRTAKLVRRISYLAATRATAW